MTLPAVEDPDRRKARTRQAVAGAMTRLIFTRRYGDIRTAELIEAAGIGRSTFYEHFRGKDDVLVAIIDPIFTPLADAAAGRGSVIAVQGMLGHVWEQRAAARQLFEPPLANRLQRKLAVMIEERLAPAAGPAPRALIATGLAASTLATLRSWLAGETPCSALDLARHLVGVKG
ncbi:TetR/AcrR family transcriptional regulator [Brevundimonas sp.]|jgi:AcrR family transcriptional regulator|uniref:TetR/AcrR family transcriptional regulator n=1 Tax=Brevundimonas sp. TaxID=1871086 RepID=UPI002E0D71D1|nr:TetR/AcrR family transcriptional regulator [Brevundimonas sp.]